MRLILSCPIIDPGAIDACMGKILSSIPLPTHQSLTVSTIHIPTLRQQRNFSRYTVSAFYPFRLFCSTYTVFFSWSSSCFLTRTVMTETTHCFKHCVAMSTKPISIETIKLFLRSCCVEPLNSTIRSHSLEVRHDQIFETCRFVLTGLESLQNCIKLVLRVESCRQRLAQ